MQRLEHPDSFYLRAAQGWLELGDAQEARSELSKISPGRQEHPDVLESRWQIEAKAKQWEPCLAVAASLIRLAPQRSSGWVHLSFALHELKRTEEAYANLARVSQQFVNEPVIPFNLACYSCQLGRLEESLSWLKRAMTIGDSGKIKTMALADEDLKPIWKLIPGLEMV